MGNGSGSRSMSRSSRVFHWIAPFYGLFFDRQARHYAVVLEEVQKSIDLSGCHAVLDVGCGTGALCSVFRRRGLAVTGVDPVQRMLDVAARKLRGCAVDLIQASVLEGIPVADRSFDLVIASYVAHGLKEDERRAMYAEMGRIARKLVVFHDYNQRRSIVTDLVEWLEGGDYFGFIQMARAEMKDHFLDVCVLDVGKRAAWYICVPHGQASESVARTSSGAEAS
jgi:ubiquinone/menaquinone biosynthesis C-methylase UbiE